LTIIYFLIKIEKLRFEYRSYQEWLRERPVEATATGPEKNRMLVLSPVPKKVREKIRRVFI